MALPKWATTVTPLSKALALLIFITFPVFGFILGMQYQKVVDISKKNSTPTPTAAVLNPSQVISLTGIVRKVTPSVPEGYYYELELDKPYYDELQASGNPYINRVPLVSVDNNVNTLITGHIGEKITVSGTMEWGLAESRYLFVEKVK